MSKTTGVSVFGVGGCGINQLNALVKSKYEIPKDVKLFAIDTSESNVSSLDKKIEFIRISAFGSGKDRKTNADIIYDQIENMDMDGRESDINIIVTSLAGGSGGLIANMLACKCTLDSKCTISLCVCDSASQKSTENTINAIKSYSNMANKYKLYFPIALYDNSEAGRRLVNQHVVGDMAMFIDLFDSDIEELDHRDKVHFLNPKSIDSHLQGVYNIAITDDEVFPSVRDIESKKKDDKSLGGNKITASAARMVHSTLAVNEDGIPVDLNALVDYVGISDKMDYKVVNGVALNKVIVDKLKRKSEQFRNRIVDKTDLDPFDIESEGENNGVIF